MKKYIIAVSGGLDSVTLLHLLTSPPTPSSASWRMEFKEAAAKLNYISQDSELIVAHTNHGIRPDSDKTEELVKGLAQKLRLQFVSVRLKLKGESEDEARRARYRALFKLKDQSGAEAIITAHNLNDTLETAIINLTRGTGWRGLCSLGSSDKIIRPLLNLSRVEISKIAARANLIWHEDSTNSDEKYLRNYIRKNVLPKHSKSEIQKLSLIINNLQVIKKDIDEIFNEMIENSNSEFSFWRSQIKHPSFSKKMLTELLVYILPKLSATYNQKVIDALAEFCLNAVSGKKFLQAGNGFTVECERVGKDYQLKFSNLC